MNQPADCGRYVLPLQFVVAVVMVVVAVGRGNISVIALDPELPVELAASL